MDNYVAGVTKGVLGLELKKDASRIEEIAYGVGVGAKLSFGVILLSFPPVGTIFGMYMLADGVFAQIPKINKKDSEIEGLAGIIKRNLRAIK